MSRFPNLLSTSILSALLAGATLAAQSAAQAPAAPKPAPSVPSQAAPARPPAPPTPPSTAQQPTFRVAVDLVTTDAIVRNSKGEFIADLTKNDFEVFEDGVKQDLASFVLVHGGRTFNLVAPPPPPEQEGIILPVARPANDAAGRIFLIFVDDLHLDFRNTGRIRELFKKISKSLIHEGDMFGIVSTGPSSLAIDLTYDRGILEDAIKRISGNGLKPTDIIQGGEGSQGPPEVRYRAHVAFSTGAELMQNLEKVHNRRKAVIWVSNGYDLNPFEASRFGEGMFGQRNPDDPTLQMKRQGNEFADADLARDLADLTRAANRANATVYSIDPRGLVAGSDLDEQVDPTEWGDYLRKSQDSLRVLAEQTGGIAVVNQNDFDKALKRIDAETSDYYVLGYYSKNPDPTRRFRRIEVKVTRKDANVWSRTSYALRPPPKVSDAK